MDIVHKDGISWYKAEVPAQLHTCWAQTEGWIGLKPVYRCACGAISDDGKFWVERNSRVRRAAEPTPFVEEDATPNFTAEEAFMLIKASVMNIVCVVAVLAMVFLLIKFV